MQVKSTRLRARCNVPRNTPPICAYGASVVDEPEAGVDRPVFARTESHDLTPSGAGNGTGNGAVITVVEQRLVHETLRCLEPRMPEILWLGLRQHQRRWRVLVFEVKRNERNKRIGRSVY